MATCFNCGHELSWQNDFMASEMGYVLEDEPDNDYIVNVLTCTNCGATTEVKQLSNNEKKEWR